MIDVIVKAAENFCIHQIRLPYCVSDDIPKKRTLIAYIDTKQGDMIVHRVYIACDEKMMQMIAEIFLGEDQSDEQTLVDMALETANMIIGSAKVLSPEISGPHFSIATPHYVKTDIFDLECDQTMHIETNGNTMIIGIKEQK